MVKSQDVCSLSTELLLALLHLQIHCSKRSSERPSEVPCLPRAFVVPGSRGQGWSHHHMLPVTLAQGSDAPNDEFPGL